MQLKKHEKSFEQIREYISKCESHLKQLLPAENEEEEEGEGGEKLNYSKMNEEERRLLIGGETSWEVQRFCRWVVKASEMAMLHSEQKEKENDLV